MEMSADLRNIPASEEAGYRAAKNSLRPANSGN